MNIKNIIVPFLLISSLAFANIQVDSIKKEKKTETVANLKQYENNFGVVSIITESYTYTGGANGITVLSSCNFDKRNGKILLFDDVFVETAKQSFEKGILQIVKNNNSGKYMSDIENVNLDDAVMYFEGDCIVFKFQKYSIAPGSSGNPAFRYNREAIKDFIKYDFEN